MNNTRPVATNQVDGVIQDYLDQLLMTGTMAVAEEPMVSTPMETPVAVKTEAPAPVAVAPVSKPAAIAVAPKPVLAVVSPTPVVAVAEVAVPELKVSAPIKTPAKQIPDVAIDDAVADASAEIITMAPATQATAALNWQSSQGIECLIFKVAGLKLAIPLPLLGGVYTVSDKVTPLFGQAAWSLGVWQGDDGKLTIIDSAELIMPERGVKLRDTGYNFFIQLDRSPWALACQEICDTVTLVHDSIKWRGDASKRPWLAGTVIAEMCALLDVPGVMKLLDDQRKPIGRIQSH